MKKKVSFTVTVVTDRGDLHAMAAAIHDAIVNNVFDANYDGTQVTPVEDDKTEEFNTIMATLEVQQEAHADTAAIFVDKD